MHKILTLFKREYKAAVRTKSFIISLLLVPIMMGGGFAAVLIMENKVDTEDKHFTVIDRTGELHLMRPYLVRRECPTCNRLEIYYPDIYRAKEDSCELKSMTTGHTLVDNQISTVFRHVGMLI